MWTAIFPIWARIAIIVGALATIFGIGYVHGRDQEEEKKDLEIAKLKAGYDKGIGAAKDALIAANRRSSDASQGANTDQATILAGHTKGDQDGTAVANARRDDRLAGRQRMRVDAICRTANAGGGGQLPGAPAVAGRADAAAVAGVAELRPDAAGRVSAATAEVEKLARDYAALQLVAQSYHDRCNQVGAAPVVEPEKPVEDSAQKRSRFKLGAPNPFDK